VFKSSMKGGSLPTAQILVPVVLLITPLHGPSRKHRFQK
jgi:hypothetical protein